MGAVRPPENRWNPTMLIYVEGMLADDGPQETSRPGQDTREVHGAGANPPGGDARQGPGTSPANDRSSLYQGPLREGAEEDGADLPLRR